jgi:hypothetical protein
VKVCSRLRALLNTVKFCSKGMGRYSIIPVHCYIFGVSDNVEFIHFSVKCPKDYNIRGPLSWTLNKNMLGSGSFLNLWSGNGNNISGIVCELEVSTIWYLLFIWLLYKYMGL